MSTKKDLVEAYAFSRRRLVTAFVSGAPGGREVEPARPGRTIVAGVAIAVLLMAGAAIAGVFDKRDDVDWDDSGLIVDADSGALYVILEDDIPGFTEPRLRSVVNVTSAQLILGSDVEAQEVSGEEIGGEPKGQPVGIIGAPATVPPADDLINSGWTSCTGEGYGVRTHVAEEPQVTPAPEAGLVVTTGKDSYLVATAPSVGATPETARSFLLPRSPDSLLRDLGVDLERDAVPVPEQWLALFPTGAPLDEDGLSIAGAGSRLPDAIADEYPRRTRVGDYYVDDDGRAYVITADGALEIGEFGLEVLVHSTPGGHRPQEQSPETIELTFADEDPEATFWPATGDLADVTDEGEEVCAVLRSEPGAQPAVEIGVDPADEASAAAAAADAGEAGVEDVTVESGFGAVVQRGGWAASGSDAPYLVDDRATAYRLRGRTEIDNLGYDEVAPVVVPDVWLELFAEGPELSQDAALCPPTTDPDAQCR